VTLDALPEGARRTELEFRAPRHAQKGLRILLVEDHRDTQRTFSRLLTHFGHNVSVANNKQSALKLLGAKEIDVLLCDVGLPDGSGYEVVSQAKRKQPIKAIAITGFGTEEDFRRSKEAGFDSHLVKPVDLHELQTVLDQVA